jgi:hypothetical protein
VVRGELGPDPVEEEDGRLGVAPVVGCQLLVEGRRVDGVHPDRIHPHLTHLLDPPPVDGRSCGKLTWEAAGRAAPRFMPFT